MEALSSAREEDARRVYDQKCGGAAVAETNHTNAMQDVFGKAEALEEHVTTVTMRAAPRHGERLLPNDPPAAQRSPEPVELAVSTAACGWSRTKSRLTFDSPNPRDLFSQCSFLSQSRTVTNTSLHNCLTMIRSLTRVRFLTRQWSKPSHRVRLLNFALLAPTRIVLLQKTRRPAS